MMKRLLPLLILACATSATWAQSIPGALVGTVKKSETGEGVVNAVIEILDGTTIVKKGMTDYDGRYDIRPIQPGVYTIRVPETFETQAKTIQGVRINPDRPTTLDVELSPADAVELGPIVIVHKVDLIERGKTNNVIEKEQLDNLPTRDIASMVAMTAGVYTADEGQAVYFRGARDGANTTIVDGVKMRGSTDLPKEAIATIEVITGGTPAQYGDVTGGVTTITTRGASARSFGSVELRTSSFLDNAHYNLGALTIGGPIWTRKVEGLSDRQAVMSYLFAGEFLYQYEPRLYGVPAYRLKQEKLDQIQKTPMRPSNVGFGTLNEGNFINMGDLEEIPARLNADQRQVTMNGSVKITTSQYTNVTLGGRFIYNRGKNAGFGPSLMNWENNPEYISTDWSAFARFSQTFEIDTASPIKSAYYQIQADYVRNNDVTWDENHQDNFFRYGHVGYFKTHQQRFYNYLLDDSTGVMAWTHILYQDTAVTFTPSPHNPIRANYTSSYYQFVEEGRIINNTFNLNNIVAGGGLRNGDNPNSVYSLFQAVGTQQAGYNKSQASQFRLTASTSIGFEGHSIIAGLEFEQRFDRAYALGTNGLWTQMRALQNQAITQLDLDNPIYVYDENGVFQDTINYNRAFDPSVPRTFDRNVRRKLGLDPNGIDYIDIDSYDPDFFSLDMFSADELLNLGGTQYVSYYGYDYMGNLQAGNPTLDDFFNARDEQGNLTRPIPAFQPIYIAGYIQDQFTFQDMFVSVGVRVDRFDANQPVLKDMYSLYPVRTVGDIRGTALAESYPIPSNIGDDYVVYVNDPTNPTSITGYRQGDTWYNASDGTVQPNPKVIADLSGGQASPYLVGDETLGTEGFKDYTPQVNVSPRISFHFPINENASFLAHYDLLVQRPTPALARFNPYDYMLLSINSNAGFLNNPNLLPQKTTDYEIGFQQKLTESSALKLSAFYREMRDMMQTVSVTNAYPLTYITYGNRDFGTVKGFTLEYEMQRTNNLLITANYTMQFADGSGSGPNSGANLARSGQPNLRYILPLDYDSRHQIVVNLDYRYADGVGYNGPVWWDKQVLANTGVNFLVRSGSGTPYSKRERAFELTQGASSVPLSGQINGSRRPWTFSIDMTINKVFPIKQGKQSFEIYLAVLNLLDTRNILNVYAYTGTPDDDGWLSSPQGSTSLAFRADAQAYADLYSIAMNSPFNYTLPRRIQLGVRYRF